MAKNFQNDTAFGWVPEDKQLYNSSMWGEILVTSLGWGKLIRKGLQELQKQYRDCLNVQQKGYEIGF